MAIARSLKDFMKKHHVAYNVIPHPRTLSSMQTAAAAHVPGDRLAKSVVLEDEDGYMVAVLPSTHRLDLGKLHHQFSRKLGLATENELRELFKDCELGAIPPVGAAYGFDTIIDDSLTDQPDIYFEAGDHEELVHVSGEQFKQLMTGSRYGHFSHHV
ncbi:MAG: aminoacyl-tRNA deacylase [Acidiferrobacterales bacterium]